MTLQELKDKLKKNLPDEFQDGVDDFASYLTAVGDEELYALIDLVVDGQMGRLRQRIVKTLSTPKILQDMAVRNDAWAARLQLRAQKKDEFRTWIKGLLRAVLVIGVETAAGEIAG